MKSMLQQHRFQFVRFVHVHHPVARGGGLNINDDHHFMHVVCGTGSMAIDKITYPLTRGSVIAVPPFVQFVGWVDAGCVMKNIHYRLWSDDGDPVEQGWRLPFVFTPDYFDHTEDLRNELEALSEASVKNPAKSAALAHEIVLDHWSKVDVCLIRPRSLTRGSRSSMTF